MSYENYIPPVRINERMNEEITNLRRTLSEKEGKVVPVTQIIRDAVAHYLKVSQCTVIVYEEAMVNGPYAIGTPATRVSNATKAQLDQLAAKRLASTSHMVRIALAVHLAQVQEGAKP